MKNRTKQFLSQLAGFLSVRDDLDTVAATVLPEDLASFYDPVGKGVKPLQDENLLREASVNPQSFSIGERLQVILEIAQNEIKPLLDAFGKALVKKIKDAEGADGDDDDDESHSHYPKYKSAPLKSKSRAEEKIRNEYDGNTLRIVDLARASVVVNSEVQLATLLSTLLKTEESSADDAFTHIKVIRFKNRFQSPTFSGYRDALFNLQVRNETTGHAMIVELQVHLAQVIVHKPMSHYYYGYFRQFFMGNMDVVEERMNLLTSLGAHVKEFRLDVDLEKTDGDEELLDMEAILTSLCKEGSSTEIDPSLLEQQLKVSDNSPVRAMIDKLLPFWDLQDVLKTVGVGPAKLSLYQNITESESEALAMFNGESDLAVDDIYGLAEEILPVFNAFGERLVEELPVYHANKNQDLASIQEALDKGKEFDIMNPYELEEASLKSKESIQTVANDDYNGNLSRIRNIIHGSITAAEYDSLFSLFEYMKLLSEDGQVEIVSFKNQFQSVPEGDLYASLIGYRHAVYHLLFKTEDGSTIVVELQVHLASYKNFETEALHYLDLLKPFLSGDEDTIEARTQLLDSFEEQAKMIQGREYAGLVEAMIQSFCDNGELENLQTFETLLGPTMLADMKVAILCCRERLWALSTMPSESLDKAEAIFDAKLTLADYLYEFARYGEAMDGYEAIELLQSLREELLSFYSKDTKNRKCLRCSMLYFAAWFEMCDDEESPEAKENLEAFQALLNEMTEVLGPDDPMTIRGKQIHALLGELDLLQEAYRQGVQYLGESHPVTLSIGIDLSFEYGMAPEKPNDFEKFSESVYKGSIAVFGRTPNTMDMELAYANNLRSAAANTTNFTADERQQMEAEAARVEALQIAGMATEYLDFAFDGKWYRKTPWSELPAKAKDAAHALNWEVNDDDETAAAAVGSCWYPMETRTWEDLSIEQCNGARTLGFNRHSWKDMFSGYLYIAQDWESLSDEIQASCRVLGWSEEKWGKTILVKEESRQWGALSLNEKEAARALNFELRSWNTMFASDAFENNDDGDY